MYLDVHCLLYSITVILWISVQDFDVYADLVQGLALQEKVLGHIGHGIEMVHRDTWIIPQIIILACLSFFITIPMLINMWFGCLIVLAKYNFVQYHALWIPMKMFNED